MAMFNSPGQATDYVIARLLEQAGREGVTFDAFELRLLNGSVSGEEIEQFEDRNDQADADEFWAKVNAVARHAVKVDRDLRQAMLLSESVPSYLNDVLIVQGIARTRTIRQTARRLILLAIVCVAGGLALAVSLILLGPLLDSASERVTKPVLSLLDKFGLALVVAVLVTELFWAVRQLRRTG